MPEVVISSLHFTGESGALGDFKSLPRTFEVSGELVFSAARVTRAGLNADHYHHTSFSISSDNGDFVNDVFAEVPEINPTIAGPFRQLSRLLPDKVYSITLSSSGFGSGGKDVSVIVELLGLDSTIAESHVTFSVRPNRNPRQIPMHHRSMRLPSAYPRPPSLIS